MSIDSASDVSAVTTPEPQPQGEPLMEKENLILVDAGAAFEYYSENHPQSGRGQLRLYLKSEFLVPVVERICRPLTEEEIRRFVKEDGEPNSETCFLCSKKFTPVTWVDLSNERFLELLEEGLSPLDAFEEVKDDILIFGSFYFDPDMERHYAAFCGRPYHYHEGMQRYFMAKSCLATAKQNHPKKYWGTCRLDLNYEIEQHMAALREEEEERARRLAQQIERDKKAQAFFSKPKTGRGCRR